MSAQQDASKVVSIRPGGIDLVIRLTPKSSTNSVDGLTGTGAGWALKARVTAIPEKGKANTALEKLIALWLDIPASTVRVSSGPKSRLKTLSIAGEPAALITALEGRL
ncbi:MAG: DUF167 family protein, partial [Beijerinckiaceae bacterium]|nr:DUF167 family protein [Beijerinckiaceae bacterium]